MKPFRFHPEALQEADEAAGFYEERQKGLGKRFIEALFSSINCITRTPKLYRKVFDNIRKCRFYASLMGSFIGIRKSVLKYSQ